MDNNRQINSELTSRVKPNFEYYGDLLEAFGTLKAVNNSLNSFEFRSAYVKYQRAVPAQIRRTYAKNQMLKGCYERSCLKLMHERRD